MIDSYLRIPYQKVLVDPLARRLIRSRHIRANGVTLMGCLFGLLVWPLLALGQPYIALAAMLLSGYLDTLDGSIARLRHATTYVGAALDVCCDRMVENAVIVGLFFVAPQSRALPCLVMLSSILLCITSFLVVGIFAKNHSEKGFYYSPGLMERAEAFLFFTAMILVPQLFTPLAFIFSGLVFLTTWLRLFEFIRIPHPDSAL